MLMRLLVAWVCLWPERWALAFGEGLGALVHALGIRRRVALENLALAFPEKSSDARAEICRAHYRHLGRSAVEFFRAARWSDADWQARVDGAQFQVLLDAIAQGQGTIGAVAHVGNFELLAAYGAWRKVQFTVVTRELRGGFNRAWMALRGHLGVRELRGKKVIAKMLEVLRAKDTLAVIIDQNMLPKRAIFVPVFGKLAATTPAPAVLSARTGSPIILAALLRQPDGRFKVRMSGPYTARGSGEAAESALMAELSAALEVFIREAPEQWFWVHRRWKTRPPAELAAPAPTP